MTISILRNVFFATLAVGSLSTALAPTEAEARPSTRSYSCEGVRDYIYHRGSVVMNTRNRRVYRRFVADRTFCTTGEVLKKYFAPTRSGHSCSLRICIDYNYYKRGRN